MTGLADPRAPVCAQRLRAVATAVNARTQDTNNPPALIAEQQRCVLGKVHLPVWPAMSAARLVPDVLHVLLREQLVHGFDPVVAGVLGAATDPEHLEFLVEHRRIRLFPVGAIAAAAECRDVPKLIEVV